MRIEILSDVDRESWNASVAALGGTFVHSYDYARFEAASPNTAPAYFRALDAAGACVGLATAALTTPRRWPLSRFARELVMPALPVAAGASPEAQSAVLAAIERAARGIGVWRARVLSYDSPGSVEVLPRLGYTLGPRDEFLLDLRRTHDELWYGLSQPRRRHVRRASRGGLTVETRNDAEGMAMLSRLFQASMDRHGVASATSEAWAPILADGWLTHGRATLMICQNHGTPASGLLFGLFGGRAYSLIAGSTPEGLEAGAPSLLYWEVIRSLSEQGVRDLNLGGVNGTTGEGVARFKRSLGATSTPQPSGLKILSRSGRLVHSAIDGFHARVRRSTVSNDPPPAAETATPARRDEPLSEEVLTAPVLLSRSS